ncbi:hypothetical protein [Pacificoceanicola onchidii]|uniref:hypothetical protein n=1 Tax=Pacificoceanicola onchidii TaxID=2562685 RepID=UPI0010A42E01|nr:hypothetical protein [Pacificoceanicola onchidii]
MSDPVTNLEIEDVLSSIRRLVSEDSRHKTPKPKEQQPDRLVLTPAHRVVDDVSEPVADESPEETPVLLTNPTLVTPEAAPEESAPEAVAEVETDAHVEIVEDKAEDDAGASEAYARLVSVERDAVAETAPEALAASEGADSESPGAELETPELESPDLDTPDPEHISISALRDEATPLMAFARKLAEAGERMEREADAAPETDETEAALPEADALIGALEEAEPPEAPFDETTADAQTAEETFAEDTGDEEATTATDILGQLVEQEVSRVFSGAFDDDLDEGDEDEAEALGLEETAEADSAGAPKPAPSDPFEALIASASKPVLAKDMASEAPRETAPAETLESKIAALEKMVSGQSEEWDAEAADEPAFVHRPAKTMAWQDPVPEELEAEETPVATTEDVPAKAETFAEPDLPEMADEPVTPDLPEPEEETPAAAVVEHVEPSSDEALAAIDEASLRLIVSEIVRQELQGALGERITRNVRKLVRREIHRAMVSQDFD